jgi:hypothetical protein
MSIQAIAGSQPGAVSGSQPGATSGSRTEATLSPRAPVPAPNPTVVDRAPEPEWVRHGSTSTQNAYESALSFEQTLVEQLSQSLTATSGLGDESGQEQESESSSSEASGSPASDAGSTQLSSMLPQALTTSVMNAGGLGLAAQMTHELEGVHAAGAQTRAAQTKTTGTTGMTGGIGT